LNNLNHKKSGLAGEKTKEKQVSVSVVSCNNYENNEVESAVSLAINQLGGIEKFVRSGAHVHIKPNLLTAKSPDKAATTHPSIVRALVKVLKGLDCRITIGDSPAGISLPIEEYWKKTGLEKVAKEFDVELVRFEKNRVVEKKVRDRSYFIAKIIEEADVVLNVCKLKTHNLVLYTGAIKNMFGVIPGFRKSEYHKQAPKPENFSRIIVDVFSAVKPQLTIMDAVVAMEGNGPSAGNPKNVGLILAGEDAVALDAVASELIGFEKGEIHSTEIAYLFGLGEKRRERIDIIGENLDNYRDLDFALPSNRLLNYVPSALVRWMGKLIWVRPLPDSEKCKRCGICIKSCPTQAMQPEDGFPVIDYDKCISCFCCDEVCPHNAIDQNMSWLAKKFR